MLYNIQREFFNCINGVNDFLFLYRHYGNCTRIDFLTQVSIVWRNISAECIVSVTSPRYPRWFLRRFCLITSRCKHIIYLIQTTLRNENAFYPTARDTMFNGKTQHFNARLEGSSYYVGTFAVTQGYCFHAVVTSRADTINGYVKKGANHLKYPMKSNENV